MPTPPSPLTDSRMNVAVQGPPVVSLDADVISIRFCENLAGCELLEILVKNWGLDQSGRLGFKYSDGNLLRIGVGISLGCGGVSMAGGLISALAPHFPSGSAATLTFTVDARPTSRNSRRRATPAALELSYGSGLIEFHPSLRGGPKRPPAGNPIVATGTAEGLPTLRAGTSVKIGGVGTAWSGVYSVTETTHTFDEQYGYRTSFACSKA